MTSLLPCGGITDLITDLEFWLAVTAVAVALLVAVVSVRHLIKSSVAAGIEKVVPNLKELGEKADELKGELEALDKRLKLERHEDGVRATVQTLLGTLIGLVGGLLANWVADGGELFAAGAAWSAAILVCIALVLVFVAPLVITARFVDRVLWIALRPVNWVRRKLGRARAAQP